MGRPRKARKQAVSLFPFLDILACVIGNLILIIATVVLEQVDTKSVAEAARIEGLAEEATREEIAAALLEQQLADLRQRSGLATESLDKVRRQIAAAKQRLADAEAQARAASTRDEPPKDSTADLKRLDDEKKVLESQIADLRRQIAERTRPPEQLIAILPSGAQSGPRKGVFVEAAKDGLIIHEGPAPWKVPTGKISSDPKFTALLQEAKSEADSIVTFLVRPDGISALNAGQKAAATVGARSGRVPLPGNGTLDFSGAK